MNNFGKFEKIAIRWIALSTFRTTRSFSVTDISFVFRDDAEKQDEESEEDLIQKAEADFFAVIEAEMKIRDTKEKQQMESLKQMNKTLTGDGNQVNNNNEELLEKDEVYAFRWFCLMYRPWQYRF